MGRADIHLSALHAAVENAFGTSAVSRIEPTENGVSTPVFRLWRGDEIFYLRLSEQPGESLGPEVRVHTRLRELGVSVPEVVFFEPEDAELGRSVLITKEIPGAPVTAGTHNEVLVEAGRELARINQLPVAGFGWLQRHRHEGPLQGEFERYEDWVRTGLERADGLLSSSELKSVERLVSEAVADPGVSPPVLAHGDFDTTQIFQKAGRFTGLIDFGERMGAEPWYDLAHFALHEDALDLAHLRAGYADITPLPSDLEERLRRTAVRIGVFRLGRQTGRSAYVDQLLQRVRALLR
jgi:aminoglycoside phosphotransferase (APT) family kinase protein